MRFRKNILCPTLLLCLLVLFPLRVQANEYHALSERAMQSGAKPTDDLTGRAVSELLQQTLSQSDEPLTLSALCGLMRQYLHNEGLVLPSLCTEELPDDIDADVIYCYRGGVLGRKPTAEKSDAPLSLGEGCLILSQFLRKAQAPDYEQPVSSLKRDEAAGVDTLENTLIMGHSNVVGLYLTVKSPLSYAARDGASTYDFLTLDDLIRSPGRVSTANIALREHVYRGIYIMLGTNDCMGFYAGIPAYRRQLAEIIELTRYYQQDGTICLIGISPIGFADAEVREELRQDVIRCYNQVQKSLSRDYGIAYLDIFAFLADENGFNRKEIARNDGLHYTIEGYEQILKEIYTHPLN